LVELRASLRRQEIALLGALQDVQGELRSWERHRRGQQARGRTVPVELATVFEELGERERELVLDLMQVRAVQGEANREIARALRPAPGRAG
jgi:FixJ family two-component response regulator